MNFQELISTVERNKTIKELGGITSILPPFPRLATRYGGFTKGSITAITASSGVGKTKFVKYFTIMNIYKQTFNTSIQPKIFYFALEESATDFWLSFIAMFLYEKYKITISVTQLKSIGSFTVTNELMAKIKEAEKFIQKLQDIVEVIDYVRNPTGIRKYINNYFENPAIGTVIKKEIEEGKEIPIGYKYKSDDTWVFFILDHISLVSNEIAPDTKMRLSSYQTFDHVVKDIILELFSKRYKMASIVVHQQTPSSERAQYTNKGALIEEMLEPSLEELHLNKGVHQDYEIVLGLFNPARHNIAAHSGYDVSLLGPKYRSLMFLKDRHYGLERASIGLYFNGANGEFEELPRPEEMNKPGGNYYEHYRNK